MGFEFAETMSGTVEWDAEPGKKHPFKFEIRAHAPSTREHFANGADGWSLSQQGGATGSAATSSGELNVTISNGGSENWHLQLVRNNIKFENTKLYRLSFDARAQSERSITFYAGRASSPWTIYSSPAAVSISTTNSTYTSSFTMTHPTDHTARLVFDLGKSTAGVTIQNVKVEELSFDAVTALDVRPRISDTEVYPIPVSTTLFIRQGTHYSEAELIDMRGQVNMKWHFEARQTSLDMRNVPGGVYILLLKNGANTERIRIIKE